MDVAFSWTCPRCGAPHRWCWPEIDLRMSIREEPTGMCCEHCGNKTLMRYDARLGWYEVKEA